MFIPGPAFTKLLKKNLRKKQRYWHYDIQHNDTQNNDIQNDDIQHDDIQHDDIQHDDIQHKGLICDTQYNEI